MLLKLLHPNLTNYVRLITLGAVEGLYKSKFKKKNRDRNVREVEGKWNEGRGYGKLNEQVKQNEHLWNLEIERKREHMIEMRQKEGKRSNGKT